MLRRGVLLAAPMALGGCAMLQKIFGAPASRDQVVAQAGFVSSGPRLIYTGEVRPGADDSLAALLEVSPEITTLELDAVHGPQGSDAALALGRALRTAGLATELRQGSAISGAGTDVFVAGTPRIIEEDAVVSWRGRNMAQNAAYAAYLDEMMGSDAVSRFLDEEAPRLWARPLTTLDIQRLGLASDGITGPFVDIGREVKEDV